MAETSDATPPGMLPTAPDHRNSQHDVISHNTQGESAGLYQPAARDVDAPGVQQPAGPAH